MRVLLVLEPWSTLGQVRHLRRLKYLLGAYRFKHGVAAILATGQTAIRQYRSVGFSSEAVLPWGYFLGGHAPDARVPFPLAEQNAVTGLYVGSLENHKGLDLAIRAVAFSEYRDSLRLEIIGSGPDEQTLRRLAASMGVAGALRWHGTVPNDVVRGAYAQADFHVLPSRYDGWGAVVNEALSAGTPSLVSSAAGSSDLIVSRRLGRIFRPSEPRSAVRELDALVQDLHAGILDRTSIAAHSAGSISAQAGAQYFSDILSHVFDGASRPLPPWKEFSAT
ncbi:glycosyltransferase [Georgenia wangjunii]|uniref:glycosyltransferase n=1 Tax=Georgenia wangjunii TaxID=3117730 RepID=UPI003D9C6197